MKSYDVTQPIRTKSHFQTALPQILAVMVKNLLLLSFGMSLGYPTILIPGLSGNDPNENFHLNEEEISWIEIFPLVLVLNYVKTPESSNFLTLLNLRTNTGNTRREPLEMCLFVLFGGVGTQFVLCSINLMCVPIGSLLSGFLTQPIGRRRSMQIIALPLAATWLIFKFANQVWHVFLALSVAGLCGGLTEAPVLGYVAEITTPSVRGMLSATSTLSVTLGVLLQFLVASFLSWRNVTLFSLGPPLIAFCLLSLLPESPHWLIMHNKLDEARKSLAWLRGWIKVEDVEEEFEEMYQSHNLFIRKDGVEQEDPKTLSSIQTKLKPFTRKQFLWPFALASFIFFLSTFTGAWTLQTYAVKVFEMFKAPLNKYHATTLLGLAEFVGCLVSIFMIRYLGKRVTGFTSICAVGLCDVAVAVYAFANNIEYVNIDEDVSGSLDQYNWMPLVFLILVAFSGFCGLKVLPWVLIGEIFSHETRLAGCGLASAVSYVFGFFANKVFLNMLTSLTIPGTFVVYGGVAFVGCLITYFALPETEGKPLHEIADHFAQISKLDNKVRRKYTKKVNEIV